MNFYNTASQEVLIRILELSEDTAPVEVSFGFIRDGHCRRGIVIKAAPSAVIKEIINDPRVMCSSLESDGLHLKCKTPQL